jgi:phage internal scaffolding protein
MNKFRTPYGKRVRCSLSFLDEDGNQAIGRTKQSHKDECDINRVLRNYDKTGLLTHVNNASKNYGDFTQVNEYRESLDLVREANEAFSEIPAEIRKEFNNNPGEFFEFVTNPANNEKLVEMGLANRNDSNDPILVKMVPTETKEQSST